MPAKIYPKRRVKTYIAEWREHYGLTQKQVAERLGCDVMTVSRWELHKTAITMDILAAIAEALAGDTIEAEDLLHHPERPTPNQLMRDQPQELQEQALSILRAMRRA